MPFVGNLLSTMDTHLNYSGFVIAGIGFFLTRFTVTLAVSNDPTRFYIAGVIPLALGLSLASFGVVLAVADVDSEFVRTTASWCVVGTGYDAGSCTPYGPSVRSELSR